LKAGKLVIGRSPLGLAAAAVYLVVGDRFTQKEIAKVFGVSEVAVRNIVKLWNKLC